MAEIPIYQVQNRAPRSMPLPELGADSFGAATARGVQEIAGAVGDAGAHLQEEHDQAQSASAAAAFAKFTTDQTVARVNAQADGTFDSAKANEAYDQGASDLQSQFTDKHVSRWLGTRLAEGRGDFEVQGATYDAKLRGVAQADDAEAMDSSFAATQVTHPDLAGLQLGLKTAADMWDSRALPDPVKAKGKRESAAKYVGAYVDGMRQSGQAATVKQQLGSGMFDAYLDGPHRAQLGDEVESQLTHERAQAQKVVELQKAQVNQGLDLLKHRSDAGEVIDPRELDQASAAAKAIGEPVKAYDFGVLRSRTAINLETKSWQPQQFRDEINKLAAKGDKASPDDEIRLDQLRKIAPQRISQFRDDPGAWAASNGVPPPQIDDHGGGFAQRSAWRQGLQRATGTWVPTLSKDEAAPWVETIQHGKASERFKAAEYINHWGAEASNVLRQVAPDSDGAFAQAVRLGGANPAAMRDAILGADVDRKLPVFKPDKEDQTTLKDPVSKDPMSAEQIVASTIGPALMRRGPTYASAAAENAMNIYAVTAQRSGWSAKLHGGELQVATNRALGGQRLANGEWAGGVGVSNGVQMLLPRNVTQRQFDQVSSRADASSYTAAGGGKVPSWHDRAMSAAELQAAIKVSVGDGLYALRLGDGYATDGKGLPFTFRYDLLAKHPGAPRDRMKDVAEAQARLPSQQEAMEAVAADNPTSGLHSPR